MTRLACLRVAVLTGALLTGLAARPAVASNAVGVYVAASRVDMMPDAATATSVVIHGAFTLLRADGTYAPPQCGQMYFQCPAGSETMCRMQWQDVGRLGTMTGVCAGFGAMNVVSTATLRLEGSPLAGPDTWDLGLGVSYGSSIGGQCQPAKALSCPLAPGSGGTGGSGTGGSGAGGSGAGGSGAGGSGAGGTGAGGASATGGTGDATGTAGDVGTTGTGGMVGGVAGNTGAGTGGSNPPVLASRSACAISAGASGPTGWGATAIPVVTLLAAAALRRRRRR
jgi:hypothetical protein